jgi:hypothetical protein
VPQGLIKFRLYTGVRQEGRRRVGILEGHSELNTSDGIGSLTAKEQKDLLVRIQRWVDGANGPKRYFHNFPGDSICPVCFVFKVGNHHRFYGYLCNPLPRTDRALQVCVLCSHAIKNEWETDPAEKKLVKRWSESSEAKAALALEFDDTSREKKSKDAKGKTPWKM